MSRDLASPHTLPPYSCPAATHLRPHLTCSYARNRRHHSSPGCAMGTIAIQRRASAGRWKAAHLHTQSHAAAACLMAWLA
jgi:hypothetical protein